MSALPNTPVPAVLKAQGHPVPGRTYAPDWSWEIHATPVTRQWLADLKRSPDMATIQTAITGFPNGRAGSAVKLWPRPWAPIYSYYPLAGESGAEQAAQDAGGWAGRAAQSAATVVEKVAAATGADRGVVGVVSTVLTGGGTPAARGSVASKGALGWAAALLGLNESTVKMIAYAVLALLALQLVTGRSVFSLARGK